MSKTTILRASSCFWRVIAVVLILLLNPFASLLILWMQPCLGNRKRAIVSGKQPSGGSGTTPILLAPKPYKSCHQTVVISQIRGRGGLEKVVTKVRVSLIKRETLMKLEKKVARCVEYWSGVV